MVRSKNIRSKVPGVLKNKLITTQNPQANAIVERVHQVIGNCNMRLSKRKRRDGDQGDSFTKIY